MTETKQNSLGTEPIGRLLLKFSVPTALTLMVNCLYNIVDQIFIGQGVGMYGNAATNVAFPLTTLATAVGLMLGIGGASNFNPNKALALRKKNASSTRIATRLRNIRYFYNEDTKNP